MKAHPIRVWTFVVFLSAVLLMASLPETFAASQTSALLRAVGQRHGGELEVILPIASASQIESVMLGIATASSTPFGIEVVRDQPLPEGVVAVRRNPQRVVLTGRTITQALTQIQAASDHVGIRWLEHDGVIRVAPQGQKGTFLDQRASLEVNDGSLQDAAVAIHRQFDPEYPSGTSAVIGSTLRPLDDFQSAELNRRFSVPRADVSIRDFLDTVVRAHGSVSWVVRYQSIAGEYPRSVILFRGFAGAGRQFGARVRR